MHVASEEGDYSFKKVLHMSQRVTQQIDTTVCGLYVLTDPNKIVEISIKYLDVNCDAGGLMAVNINQDARTCARIIWRVVVLIYFCYFFYRLVFRRMGIE